MTFKRAALFLRYAKVSLRPSASFFKSEACSSMSLVREHMAMGDANVHPLATQYPANLSHYRARPRFAA